MRGRSPGIGPTNLPVSCDLPRALAQADVALDFSSAAATPQNLRACRSARKPLLIGTTGFGAELSAPLVAAARDIPLLVAANTSIGVALLAELVRAAARSLPPSFDIDVLELHHRLKPDAPSGTALALGRAAAEARGLSLPSVASVRSPAGAAAVPAPATRAGARPRPKSASPRCAPGTSWASTPCSSAGPGEQLALSHRALDRAIFARGALSAGALACVAAARTLRHA